MKLTIKERFQAVEILPKSYDLDMWKIMKSIRDKICFKDEEVKKYNIVVGPLGTNWDEKYKDEVLDLSLTDEEVDFLKACAGTLNKNKQLNDLIRDFCIRLLDNKIQSFPSPCTVR